MIEILIKNSVFIAHCLTKNGGAGNPYSTGKDIYQRIEDAIKKPLELCCSTIRAGDKLDYPHISNFFGPVGIILKPGIITYASPIDGGTHVAAYGIREYPVDWIPPAKIEHLLAAIMNRSTKGYNELLLKDYVPVGLFMCHDEPDYLYQQIGSELDFHVHTEQYQLPYYNLMHGILYPCIFDGKNYNYDGSGQVAISSLYS